MSHFSKSLNCYFEFNCIPCCQYFLLKKGEANCGPNQICKNKPGRYLTTYCLQNTAKVNK